MQILLTEKEYEDLKAANVSTEKEVARRVNENCQSIADTMLIAGRGSMGQSAPHGCIYSGEKDGYCDRCPVHRFCTMDKRFSK